MKIDLRILVFFGILFIIPLFIESPFILHLLITSFVFSVICASWDLTMGYLGLFNFGHLAFFGIGAYTTGILTKFFNISPWIGLATGAVIATLFGFILSLPISRIGASAFSLFSLAFQEVLFYLIRSNPYGLTGGAQGLFPVPQITLGSIEFGGYSKVPIYYLILIFFFLTIVILFALVRSRFGFAISALKSSENYAISRGIDPFYYKAVAITSSAFFTGLIGASYAHFLGVVGPEIIGWNITILSCCIVMFGGPGTLFGPVAGAFLITGMSTYLTGFEAYKYVIIALVMLLIILRFPSGMAGAISIFQPYFSKVKRDLYQNFGEKK
jgi:branched-chain amino acid transport system permease protein